jgi:taurine dioxygenase
MEVLPRGRALGAEVVGLTWPLTDGELDGLQKALLDHQVVFVRDVTLTPEEHVRLGERLGEVEVHAFFPNRGPGHEQVSVLDSEDGTVASMWHTDETFLERPPMGTLLHAQVIPPVGGDTCFASMTAAYDALSAPMKRYLDGLTAEMKLRSGRSSAAELAEAIAHDRRCTHPVVRTHPETGARSLYVNPTYTRWLDGVPTAESEALLQLLFVHATHERFVYRHRWQAGDLLLWDNRCTMHIALADFEGHRRMHRVSVLGARPEGA